MWECSQCLGCPGFAPTHGLCTFPVYTSQALGCTAGELSEVGLGYVHFPGLSHSHSGSWVLHKGTDLVGPAFLPFPGPSSSADQVLGECSHPQLEAASYHVPHPSCSVFLVYNRRAFSGVPCVSSGELISGCDPPARSRPSRIPRSLG